MITLFLRFPARRYHTTPQGHHVNEGLIEWPPSPWRLLRALLSVGYTSGLWDGNGPSPEARSLIEKLAGVLPSYFLPSASGAHSRHYMPLGILDKGREKTTLVFDTWAQIGDGELAITWNVDLTGDETGLLAQLAERLGYLGRSESWVMARLAETSDSMPVSNCFPEQGNVNPGPGWEQVPLMAAESASTYLQWREHSIGQALASFPLPEIKPSKKLLDDRKKAEEPYPPDLIACLQAETNWLRRYGWSQPPGSRRVFYWRRVDALESGAPPMAPKPRSAAPVEAMLLSMATAGNNDHALPSVARTLPQAELLHRALVSISEKQNVHSRVLTGCDENGSPLRGPHEHAHILPFDLDRDGHIDHILIWAPMGLDAHAQAVIRTVRRTFTKGGLNSLKLALSGAGALDDLRGLPGAFGEGLRKIIGSASGATEWITVTPFVPPRYLKNQGKNTIEGQVNAELASRGLPAAVDVSVLNPREDIDMLRLRHFIRKRRSGPLPPADCGFILALRFEAPLIGPLCLGYGSHFGLGVFMPGQMTASVTKLKGMVSSPKRVVTLDEMEKATKVVKSE